MTKAEAIAKMTAINSANLYKRPYVRVAERAAWECEVDGGCKLVSYVNVYSKTWSRRVCKLVIDGVQYGTREARKYLSK